MRHIEGNNKIETKYKVLREINNITYIRNDDITVKLTRITGSLNLSEYTYIMIENCWLLRAI